MMYFRIVRTIPAISLGKCQQMNCISIQSLPTQNHKLELMMFFELMKLVVSDILIHNFVCCITLNFQRC